MKKFLFILFLPLAQLSGSPWEMPTEHPRTMVLPGQVDSFREYVLTGEGADFFAGMRKELDAVMDRPFPEEPPHFGDSSPQARTAAKINAWRAAQDTCGWVAGVAEAAALVWVATGEERYLEKAQEFLVKSSRWDPNGTTGVDYNDEAHFRLWRKLPLVYDLVRDQLSETDREKILASFRARGNRAFESLAEYDIQRVRPNTVPPPHTSHPIRFISMTGLVGAALWDDLPEARDWFALAVRFYRESFTPWGGEDGGWAEGVAYWRALNEHGRFQDALLALDHPEAWNGSFWRETGYFPTYFLQRYEATSFGDIPVRGKINMQAQISQFLERAGRLFQDGYLISASRINPGSRNHLLRQGLYLGRNYPTGMEHLIRHFQQSLEPMPDPLPLTDLPQARHFRDIGWVSMHSELGNANNDIMLSFKSSPYASFSHSHGDQNAFILNAYGENLAINSGYREFHRSAHHAGYTRHTRSKNAILIGGHGQEVQTTEARGKITRFGQNDRVAITTGDATEAYQSGPEGANVLRATRDVVMIDRRYFVIRDVVHTKEPRPISWLLHAEAPITWSANRRTATVQREKASLAVQLHGPSAWNARSWTGFPIAVEPQYVKDGYTDQFHFAATTPAATRHEVWAVLWPDRRFDQLSRLNSTPDGQSRIRVTRPDGRTDLIVLDDNRIEVR